MSALLTPRAAGGSLRHMLEWTFLAAIYLAPTIVAIVRKHNEAQVAVLNILLGWTFVGWVVALVMAVGKNRDTRPALPPQYDIYTGERIR